MKKRYFKILLFTIFGLFIPLPELQCLPSAYDPKAQIPSRIEIQAMEAKVFNLINRERKKNGFSPLREWKVLATYAREHSWNIAMDHVDFGHHGFEARAEAIKTFGRHQALGENVAYSYLLKDPLTAAVNGWMRSPGHRENILGDYDETGVGIAYSKEGRCYITQLFAKRGSQ
jgi:uncharacterized protein YkwD